MDDLSNNRFGKRDARHEKRRLAGALFLIGVLVLLEITLGARLERENRHPLETTPFKQIPLTHLLKDYSGQRPVPPKPPGVTRILYLSNSHATTGGRVSAHLRGMLEALAPGRFQVLDLSTPGIVASSILQRAMLAMEMEVDLVVLQVAYISFSDRFKLALQDFHAEHFFRPGIFERLPWGFWWRNYDVGMFADHLVNRFLRLTLYRNELRGLWETPLIERLKPLSGSRPSRILEVDKNWVMTMPGGFDPTLFDWSLYALGRDGHLADLRDLMAILNQAGMPVIGANLPIDFAKRYTKAERDDADFAQFQREMAHLFSSALRYTNYQACFPVSFTTYDPLHPTWTGARLHAAHLVLLMAESGWWRDAPSPERLSETILDQESAIPDGYLRALREVDTSGGRVYRRYDVTDGAVASHLLGQWSKSGWDSPRGRMLLEQTLARLNFWMQPPAPPDPNCPASFQGAWPEILHGEYRKHAERLSHFRAHLETRASAAGVDARRVADKPIDWSIRRP
ncbi:MAG: hypothetical protein HQM01_05370 [Magnetococcales bacterium]|nr:hypothetical protein [Magnetococcales bacterium]